MFHPINPHPNFPELEEKVLKFWEREKIFEQSLEKTKKGQPFTFYDGPPFATGLPHYGHILASTIKDVIPRYQTMKGRYVRRRWGWDCHGLPIEEVVERELKISGKKQIEKLGIKKFNETCRSMVLKYAAEWRKMVRRIARWVDFDNSYKTMDRDYMESVWWAFKQIYDKGLVYEGRKVLLYCPRCETPISNFEVAMDNSYQEVTEEAVTVKFRVKSDANTRMHANDANGFDKLTTGSRHSREDSRHSSRFYLLAWTTTPWTLAGNVALAVGENIDYVRFKKGDEYYIAAKTPTFSPPHEGEKEGVVVDTFKGRDLVGLEYEPLFDVPAFHSPLPNPPHQGEGKVKENTSPVGEGNKKGNSSPLSGGGKVGGVFKVYPADFVNTEEGTGIVHTAVVYGEDDYNLGLKYGLPVVPMLDEKGIFNENAPEIVQGKFFKDSEKTITDDLEKRGLLFEKKKHAHSYPHCWRCEAMLFYNAIPAWFINIQKIKKQILKSNKREINWYPAHLKFGRYAKSVEAAPDWNISRNRYWGNPMPVWKCGKCGKNIVVGSVEELTRKIGRIGKSDVRPPTSDLRLQDLHRPYIDEVILKCDSCGGEARRITEIFDSWMEAGSMPFAEYHYPFENKEVFESRLPAQFVAEYIAQTRAWFYVMHVISLILFGKAPFENVVTTGTILAEDGSKMSKSRRNFPDPWEVIDKYGVDSLRFYLMNSVVMQADNLNFSVRDLENVNRKIIRILWNVYNYFVTYANQARTSAAMPPPSSPHEGGSGEGVLDSWILARLQELVNNVTRYLDLYDTVKATREIEAFINDLSTWYLRRSRGRSDEAFFATLHFVLVELSKVIAPVMPYLAEVIYQNLVQSDANTLMHANDTNGFDKLTTGSRHSSNIRKLESLSVHLSDWPKAKKLTRAQESLLVQMQEIRKIAEQVHALRAKAGVKLRQKLGRLVIPRTPTLSPPHLFDQAQGDPEYHRMGHEGEKEGVIEILKDEVNVQEVVTGDKLELDTNITPELKLEGLVRELERRIQEFRKESGLKIGEMVDLYYETKSDMIKKAVKLVDRKKIYVKELRIKNQELRADFEKEIEVEGESILIGLKITNSKHQIPNKFQ
jgi:isoleucyl-tRNA synthetase